MKKILGAPRGPFFFEKNECTTMPLKWGFIMDRVGHCGTFISILSDPKKIFFDFHDVLNMLLKAFGGAECDSGVRNGLGSIFRPCTVVWKSKKAFFNIFGTFLSCYACKHCLTSPKTGLKVSPFAQITFLTSNIGLNGFFTF